MTDVEAIIDDIRQSRRQMSEQCRHDPAAYIEYMKKFNAKYSAQVERYHKERPTASTTLVPIGH